MKKSQQQCEIRFDLDWDRIRSVLREAYRTVETVLETNVSLTEDEFVSRINPYEESNRVSVPVTMSLPTHKYPQLSVEVDLRRGKVFARIPSRRRNHPKQVLLNRYLRSL